MCPCHVTTGAASTDRAEDIRPQPGFVVRRRGSATCRNRPLDGTHREGGGHPDHVGTPEANQRLSQERAQAVMAALVQRGVKADQLTAKGYGQTAPIADNRTEDGRAKNRRVELVKK